MLATIIITASSRWIAVINAARSFSPFSANFPRVAGIGWPWFSETLSSESLSAYYLGYETVERTVVVPSRTVKQSFQKVECSQHAGIVGSLGEITRIRSRSASTHARLNNTANSDTLAKLGSSVAEEIIGLRHSGLCPPRIPLISLLILLLNLILTCQVNLLSGGHKCTCNELNCDI
jgi:hypothetical protein